MPSPDHEPHLGLSLATVTQNELTDMILEYLNKLEKQREAERRRRKRTPSIYGVSSPKSSSVKPASAGGSISKKINWTIAGSRDGKKRMRRILRADKTAEGFKSEHPPAIVNFQIEEPYNLATEEEEL